MIARRRTYLDWAASAPVAKTARKAFEAALGTYGNPSSPHAEGVRAKAVLETARATIAQLTEARSENVIFTSGATEANNLAILGHVHALRAQGIPAEDIHILYLPSAHASVIESIHAAAEQGIQTEELLLIDGTLDVEDLKSKLTPRTRLVVLEAVCGETGMRYETRRVRAVLDAYAQEQEAKSPHDILLHVDASQAPLVMPFDLTRLGADMLTLDAQKVGGIRGVGALVPRPWVAMDPLLHGGGQECELRPGTEPVALAAAFAAALLQARKECERFAERALTMRNALVARIISALPGTVINEGATNAPHILNLSFPGLDTDYAVMLLDAEGFAASTKSACETDAAYGSRAVLALTKDEAHARSTLRISWGPDTTVRDLERFSDALIRTVHFLEAA